MLILILRWLAIWTLRSSEGVYFFKLRIQIFALEQQNIVRNGTSVVNAPHGSPSTSFTRLGSRDRRQLNVLLYACHHGVDWVVVECLMKWNASVGGGIMEWSQGDNYANSPLLSSCLGGHTQLALHLMEKRDAGSSLARAERCAWVRQRRSRFSHRSARRFKSRLELRVYISASAADSKI